MAVDDTTFPRNAPSSALGDRALSSAIWVGAAQMMRTLATLGSTLIVARILSPNDYGVMAMLAPVLAFIVLFQDLGLSQSVIQSTTLPHKALSGLFWINIVASVTVAILIIISSPIVAAFYHDVRVGHVMAASAATVLVTGSSILHAALLSRDLRFRILSLIEIFSAIMSLAVTVVAALVLRNYWALWLGVCAAAVAQSAGLWLFGGWRPQGRISFAGTRKLIGFGSGVTGFNLVNFVVRNLDNILIARYVGAAALGLYDQSYKLMMAPMQAVNGPLGRVMTPVLSRLQDDPVRYRSAFLMALRTLLIVLTPGISVAAALSSELIPFLLGKQWAAAAPIFFWLSLTGLLQPVANATGWLFLSSGRTTAMFNWGIFSAAVTAIGFAVGLQWGAVGVAAALFFTVIVRVPILFIWCTSGTSVGARDLYASALESVIGAIPAALIARAAAAQLPFPWALCTGLIAAYVLAGLAHSLTPSGREYFQGVYRLIAAWCAPRLLRGRAR